LVLISWELSAVRRMSLCCTILSYRNTSITHNVVYFQYTNRIADTYGIVALKMFVSVCIQMRAFKQGEGYNDEMLKCVWMELRQSEECVWCSTEPMETGHGN
jgi:hypothetical protein